MYDLFLCKTDVTKLLLLRPRVMICLLYSDKNAMVEQVIPIYFGQTKFESFTRQLSGWGFKRLHQSGPDHYCYYHEWYVEKQKTALAFFR